MAKDYSALIEALESGAMASDEIDSLLEQNPQISRAEEPDYSDLINQLEKDVATSPMSFEEYKAAQTQNDKRSLIEKTYAFGESALMGGSALIEEGKNAIKEVYRGNVGWDELKGVFDVGSEDIKQFYSTVAGAASDMIFANDDEAMLNEYNRYKDNFEYYQNARPKLVEEYTTDAPSFVSFGANFVDPTILVPFIGPAARLGSITLKSAKLGKMAKMMDAVEKATSLPAKGLAKGGRYIVKEVAKKGAKVAGGISSLGKKAEGLKSAITGAGVGGYVASTVNPFLGAGLGTFTAFAPKLAKHTGKGMESILSALGTEAGQKRFLQRLAVTADTKAGRQAALLAHKAGGTRLGDMMFNGIVNGTSVATLNAALAYAAGGGPEESGQAFGQGAVSGAMGVMNQPGMKAGKTQAARDASSIRFLESKLVDNQLQAFRKLSPEAKLAFSTLEEAGVPSPSLVFLSGENYLNLLRSKYPDIKKVPNAEHDPIENRIYINEDGDMSKGSKEALAIVTEELGHHFITQGIKNDPLFAHRILEGYRAKKGEDGYPFVFLRDSFGKPIETIMLNEKAKKFATAYDALFGEDAQNLGINDSADRLAQELGAHSFSLMLQNQPNAMKALHPSITDKFLSAGEKVLSLFGAVDPITGNPLSKSAAPIVKRDRTLANLYSNYLNQLDKQKVDRAEMIQSKIRIPRNKTPDQAFTESYGADGITMEESKIFLPRDKAAKQGLMDELNLRESSTSPDMDADLQLQSTMADNELKLARRDRNKAKKDASENPDDPVKQAESRQAERKFNEAKDKADSAKSDLRKSGRGMVAERGRLVGKEIPDNIYNLITDNGRKDPKGRVRAELQKIATAINSVRQMAAFYRSSKPSIYGHTDVEERFFTPLAFEVNKIKSGSPQIQLQVIDEKYLRMNLDALVREGLVTDPDGLMEQARLVAQQARNDPQGRINPLGQSENELITALFGLRESGQKMKDPKLQRFMDTRKNNHAIRSFDLFRAAGMVETGRDGISFDWWNVKNNYSPPSKAILQPRGVETGFSTENITAPKFLDKVLGDLSVDVQRAKYDVPNINLTEHFGKNALITMSDRTPAGHVIHGIKGVEFKKPLRLGGGRDYMFDQASPDAVWANEQNAMTSMLNRKRDLGNEDMLVIPMEMAPTSVDFPTMAPALHMRYSQVAMSKKDKRYVNSLVRNGGKGHLAKDQDQVKVPDFDIDIEDIDGYLGKLTGPQRKTINNVFDMVNRPSPKQKDAGVRQVDGALHNMEMRAAISDPEMFNQQSLMQTTNVGLITGGQVPSNHDTYNAAMQGVGLGRLLIPRARQASAQDFLPEVFRKSTPERIDSTDAYTARMGVRTARIDEDLLSRLGY
jgi:hypothetical protein